ncbi:retention module-containing protein [Achromobacter anxifer]
MANSSPAIVTEITGRAWIRNSDGSLTELHEGSKVPAGSDVVTASGATVALQVENGMPLMIGENREVALNGDAAGPLADPSEAAVAPPSGTDSERLLAALQAGRDPFDELDPTAAVVAGGGDNGGSSFVRLARILEVTTPLDLAYPNPARGNDVLPRLSGTGAGSDEDTGTGVANTPPQARDDAAGGLQDALVRGNLLTNDSDPDGDPLALVSVNGRPMGSGGLTVPGSNGGVFTIAPDGSYVFDPRGEYKSLGEGQTATSTVSYTITDPSGATSTATLTVTITGTNDLPVAPNYQHTTPEDQPVSGKVTGTDPDGDTLTYTVDKQPEHGKLEFNPATGEYTYTPNENYNGPDQFTVIVDDGHGGKTTSVIEIGVTPVNDAPLVPNYEHTTPEEQPVSGKVVGTDVDGDNLTYTVEKQPENGTLVFNPTTGEYTYTPNENYNGPDQFTVIVDDGHGGKATSIINIGVTPVLDVPTITVSDAGDVNEGSSATFNISLQNTVDLDKDTTVTLKLDGQIETADHGAPTVTIGGQTVQVTANADGTYSFTLPAGTTGGIVVTVPTNDDAVFEGREQMTLTATLTGETSSGTLPSGISDSGNAVIVDTESTDPGNPNPGADVPTLDVSNPGDVNEGSDATFNITLGKAVDAETTITFKLGGEIGADDIGAPVVTIGGNPVTLVNNGNGTYSFQVPAGTTGGIVVTVPTTDDAVFEGRESLTLEATLSGKTASGVDLPAGITDTGNASIVDDQGAGADVPKLDVSSPGDVNEGADATFNITLDKAVDAETTITFKFGGDIEGDDIGAPVVTIGGTTVNLVNNGNGTYSFQVPAGTTGGIVVTVPTNDDAVFEGRESLTLEATLSGKSASGIDLPAGITDTGTAVIVDTESTDPGNPNPGADVPTLDVSNPGDVNEGADATFNITLDKAVDAETTITFKFGGDIEGDDIGTPVVTIGGTTVTLVNNGNGTYSFQVPAGTTGGIVVTVPTNDDAVFEGRESLTLEATLSGKTASGVDLPSGITDTGTAVIVDTESTDPGNPNPGADVPTLDVSNPGDVNEGADATFNITLDKAVDAETTITFKFGGDIEGDDIGTPVVTIGGTTVTLVNNGNGTYSFQVPAGTTGGIVVTVPTNDDAVFEGRESLTLEATLSGKTASGVDLPSGITDTGTAVIVDDHGTGADVPKLDVSNPGDVNEGTDATFNITLDKAVDAETTITFKFGGDIEGDDIGAPVVTIGGTTVTLVNNGNGTYSFQVPAGTTGGIVVTVPTNDDAVFEGRESLTLEATLSGKSASGIDLPAGITDTGTAVIVDDHGTGADVPKLDVSNPGDVNEGTDATFNITLDKAVDAETTITFKFGGDIEGDDIGTPVVTIGGTTVNLVNNGNGTYSFQVPAGTTGGIVVTVPTNDDAVFEGRESLTLEATLSGKTASGVDLPSGITDTGTAVIVDTESTDPGNPNPGADVPTLDVSNPGDVNEGADATFNITLDKAVDAETTITFKFGGDIEGDDIGAPVVTIGGTTVTLVNNGNGTYSFQVPAGTTGGIVVTVPTNDDAVFEGRESLTLEATLSGKTASGVDLPSGITDTGTAVIVDDHGTGADVPKLDVSNPGDVNEGTDATFNITLDKAVDAETTITFKFGGDIEGDDIGAPVVTIGGTTVTLVNNGNGTYSFQVPAGTTGGIVVTVPTNDDAVFEGRESLTLEATLSGKSASGIDLPAGITDTGTAVIVDDHGTGADVPKLDVSNPGDVNEGTDATFNITLDKAVDAETTITFKFGGDIEGDDIGAPVVTIGGTTVTLVNNGNGTYSFQVPAGTTGGIVVTVPTNDDAVFEGRESLTLEATLSGKSASGIDLPAGITDTGTAVIVDDHGTGADVPKLDVSNPGDVNEGTDATFNITLDKAVDAQTTITFKFGGDIEGDDIGAPVVTIGGTTVTLVNNGNGTYSFQVPAGTTGGIVVTVPTNDDAVFEGRESLTLEATLSGKTASGIDLPAGITDTGTAVIVDDHGTGADVPKLDVSNPGDVNEGTDATFNITLDKAVDAETTITFKFGGDIEGDDIGAPVVTIGGTTVTLVNNGNGTYSFQVPAGTTGGIVVTVPTNDDAVFEGRESLTLEATLSGKSASGIDLPAGITDTGTAVIVDDHGTGADVPKLDVSNPGDVNEGTDATFNITLDKAVDAETTITFKFGGDIEGDDIGAPVVTIGGTTVTLVNNGNGTYSFQVPAGTTGGIAVTVPTNDDAVFEGREKLTLEATLSGKSASGVDLPAGITDTGNAVIVDDHGTGADVPTLNVDDAGTVNEGSDAVFNVSLGKAVDADTTLTFKLGGEIETSDIGTVKVTIGGQAASITTNPDGSFSVTVPAGTTGGIVVTVPTTADGVFEGSEKLTLTGTLTGASASGIALPGGITDAGNATIVDILGPGGDAPTLDVSDPGNVNEGSDAVFNVTLGKPVNAETTITFKLGGDIESDDIGAPVVTIGGNPVTLVNNGNGTYSFQVPAGTTGGIVVTVPTNNDAVFEGSEKLTLEATLTGTTASGTALPPGITDTGNAAIVDTQGPGADVPTLDVSDPGNVNEGSNAKFDITLGKAVDAETTITFKLGGDIESDDIGAPVVTIGGNPVTLVNNGNGTYSFQVPAGTTGGIVVTVPTNNDAVFEGSEKLTLEATLTGTTASGTALPPGITDTGNAAIVDTQGPGADVPTLDVSDPGNVNEGSNAKFDITLGKAVDAETTITFKLGGDIESDDIGAPVVTIGGNPVTLVNNGNGTYSFQVPAGTTGGIVVTVPTNNDAVFEGSEKLTLEATLTGTTASGTALPPGITDTGNAAIVDTQGPGADVPTLDVSDPGNVNEGSNAKFDITLGKAVDAETTITFKLGGDIESDDIGAPVVTIGGNPVTLVNNGNGTYSFQVPAGTTGGIVVTVPTNNDAVFEGSEKLTLEATLTGTTASGTALPPGITDTGNAAIVDTQGPGADVPTLDVSDPGNVNEGSNAKFDITLGKAVDAETTITFKLGGDIESDDIGAPVVTIGGNPVTLVNNGNGTYSFQVPAGTTGGIVVTVPTNNDAVFEGSEKLTLEATLTGTTASGTALPPGITDTGNAAIVDTQGPGADVPTLDVSDPGNVNEGSNAKFDITLGKAVDAETTITFKLGGDIESDDIGAPVVTIGGNPVTLVNNGNGTYSFQVPAGTTGGIVVTVPTNNDAVFEGSEKLTLEATLTGTTASGTALPPGITDTGNAAIVDTQGPGADVPTLDVSDPGNVNEGSNAKFDITLGKAVDAETTITFKLGGDIESDDIGAPVVTIGGNPVTLVNNGNGTYSFQVPAGTTGGIVVTVPTNNDAVFEGSEKLTLEATLTGTTASGTALPPGITDTGNAAIVDTQGPGADVPTLDVSDPGNVNEGSNAKFDITLGKAVDAETTITFKLGGDIESDDIGAPVVTIGGNPVTLVNNGNGTYSFQVPAGTTGGIVVTVPTNNDAVFEGSEKLTLEATLTGTTASGTALPPGITDTGNAAIVDTQGPGADVPTLDVSDPGNVNEGSNAKFDITLGKAVDAETTITFKLGGDIESDDIGAPVVTIGGNPVTLVNNGNGTYSFQVPAGTTGGIVVTVPTNNDAVFEGSEKLTLEATLTGTTASGTALPPGITDTGNAAIVDTQGPGADVPTLDVSDPGNVNEGSNAKFDITLGKAVDAETTITFKLGGDIESDDIGAPVVTIGGNPVTLVNNGNGTYSFQVPAGTTGGIVVTVPTNNDAVFEGSEKLTLEATLTGTTASGTALPPGITDTGNAAIVDTQGPGADVPTLDVSDPGNVNEGSNAKFDITLGKAVDAETTITFKLGGDIESDDIGAPVVTIGGNPVTLVNNGNGTYSFQVPAGTTGGIVVTVPTNNDAVFEGSEKLTLEATLTGTTASGTALPPGITDTGNAAIVDTQGPGADVPTLDVSDPGNVNEGSNAKFDITLGKAVDAETTITFKLGGDIESDDIGAPVVTIGGNPVTLVNNGNGTYSFQVPAGTTGGIVVTVPTNNDAVFEGSEKLTLEATLTGTTASGTALPPGITDTGNAAIVDTQGPGADVPTLDVSDPGNVNEGSNAKFDITLGKAVDAETTITFKLGGDIESDDIGAPVVTIGGNPVTLVNNGNGTYSFQVPAGTTGGIVVTVPTNNDAVFEGSEKLTLEATLTGTTASGTALPPGITDTGNAAIVDTQGPGADVPKLDVKDAGDVIEGNAANFNVSLDKAVDAETTLTFKLGGEITAADHGVPTVSIGGQSVTVTANADGTYSFKVPAGTTGGIVVTVPTTPDGVYEGRESMTLTATLTGATASGTALPPGITDSGNAAIVDINKPPVVEGGNTAVSEEGLAGGIKDSNGTSDTTDSPQANGQLSITDDNNATYNITLVAPANGALTSHGTPIVWTLSDNGHTLTGRAGGTDAIVIKIDDNGAYNVKLLAPVDHPDTSREDTLGLSVGVKVSDGVNPAVSTNINITIEDDSPVVQPNAPVSVQTTNIPEVYTGKVSFAGTQTSDSKMKMTFGNGAIEVTAKGFTSKSDVTLIDAMVNQSKSGLGVASTDAPYHNIANEIDYRKTSDGKGASEELTIHLTGGKVAYGATIDFGAMYGGELESGIAKFYRNGVLIAERTFTSDQNGGDYAANFRVEEGGFDTIVISATDNHKNSSSDNSDFTVTGITFLGSDSVQAIAYGEGTLNYGYGADGAGRLELTGAEGGLKTRDGANITVKLSNGNLIEGRDPSGNLVFEMRLTPATGKWEFYQYQPMQGTADGKLDFTYKVTDADGDYTNGHFEVAGVEPPGPSLSINDYNLDAPGAISVSEALASNGGTFTITAGAGLKSLTLDGPDNADATLTLDRLADLANNPVTLPTSKGTLTLTGYDPSTGKVSYTYQSSGPQSHTGDDTNVQDHFQITVEDKFGGKATGDLGVLITDTAPSLKPIAESSALSSHGTNIMLTLDTSGSMAWSSGVNNSNGWSLSRLDVLKSSVNGLLDKYGEAGDVRVLILEFNSSATQKGSGWMSLAEAKTFVNGLYADGGTNYQDALTKAMAAWNNSGTGKLEGNNVQNISYFFTDGEPDSNRSVSSSQQTTWEKFLADNHINSYGIGLGTGATGGYIDPISYNPDRPADSNTILVKNLNGLDAAIDGTIAPPINGDIAAGGTLGSDLSGARITQLVIEGKTYSYNVATNKVTATSGATYSFDPATSELTVTTAHGKFTLDLAGDNLGDYRYVPKTAGTDTIQFTVQDGDGDTASSSITVNVTAPVYQAPDAVNDKIITNIMGTQLTVQSGSLLANDVRGTGALTLGPLTVNTGWDQGKDFTRSSLRTYDISNNKNTKELSIARSEFTKAGAGTDKAQLVVKGYLDKVGANNGNDQDTLFIALIAGEVLTLDHSFADPNWIRMEYRLAGSTGPYTVVADGGTIPVTESGNYEIHIVNIPDNGNGTGNTSAENYTLTMKVDYSNVNLDGATANSSYTIQTADGHSDNANVSVSYQSGNHLVGTNDSEILLAGNGNDTLDGGKGNDVLIGGKGNDVLTGGEGSDTFRWELNDQGTTSAPATDRITDFSMDKPADGGDVLDLKDLLVGEKDGNLSQYLNFKQDPANANNTLLEINTQGKLGTQGADQKIVLENVDLTHNGQMDNQAIINDLLQKGKLNVDHS